MTAQLVSVIDRLSPKKILELQERISIAEKARSKVLCFQNSICANSVSFNNKIQNKGLRIVIRPLGMSFLRRIEACQDSTDSSYLWNIERDIDYQLLMSMRLINEYETQTFKQNAVVDIQNMLLKEFEQQTDLDIFIKLISCIKLMLSDQLYRLNQNILDAPDQIGVFFQKAFTNQFKYQSLQQALEHFIGQNQFRLIRVMKKIANDILQYLNKFIPNRASHLQVDLCLQNLKQNLQYEQIQMSQELQTIIERSVISDLDRLSNLIIDVEMLKEYVSHYNLFQDQDQDQDQETYENEKFVTKQLSARHHQIIAVNNIFQTQLFKKTEIFNQCQVQFSILSELIYEDKSFYKRVSHSSQNITETARDLILSQYLSVESNPFSPKNISIDLLRFLDKFSFDYVYVKSMGDYLAIMPDSASFDLENQDYEEAQRLGLEQQVAEDFIQERNYERQVTMMLLEFYRAYTVARLEHFHKSEQKTNYDQKQKMIQQFCDHIENCVAFLFSDQFALRAEYFQVKLFAISLSTMSETLEQLVSITENKVYQSALVMIEQFKNFKLPFFAFKIIQRTLDALEDDHGMQMENKLKLKDIILEKMFANCLYFKQTNGIQMMYKTCLQLQNLQVKSSCIIKLFEEIVKSGFNADSALKSLTFDNQTVNQVIATLFEQVESLVYKKQFAQQMSDQSSDRHPDSLKKYNHLKLQIFQSTVADQTKEEISLLVQVLHYIGKIYDKNEEISKYLWNLSKKIITVLEKNIFVLVEEFETNITEQAFIDLSQYELDQMEKDLSKAALIWLQLRFLLLSTIDKCFQFTEKDFFLVEQPQKQLQNCGQTSQRRSHDELERSSQELNSLKPTCFDIPPKEDYLLDEDTCSPSTLSKEDIKNALLLNNGWITLYGQNILISIKNSNKQINQIVMMLSELNFFDQAIEIALSYKLDSVSYCLFTKIENIIIKHSKSSKIDSQRKIDEQVAFYINRLSTENLLNLARLMIAQKIQLPLELSSLLVSKSQTSQVIKAYLNGRQPDPAGMCTFLKQDSQDQFNRCLKSCIETDSGLLKELITTIKQDKILIENQCKSSHDQIKLLQREGEEEKQQQDRGEDFLQENFQQELTLQAMLLQQTFKQKQPINQYVDLIGIVGRIETEADNQFKDVQSPQLRIAIEQYDKAKQLHNQLADLEQIIEKAMKEIYLNGNKIEILRNNKEQVQLQSLFYIKK